MEPPFCQLLNTSAPGDFVEKHLLKLIESFSGHLN